MSQFTKNRACDWCHNSKVKCPRLSDEPCSNCARRSILCREYIPGRMGRPRSNNKDTATERGSQYSLDLRSRQMQVPGELRQRRRTVPAGLDTWSTSSNNSRVRRTLTVDQIDCSEKSPFNQSGFDSTTLDHGNFGSDMVPEQGWLAQTPPNASGGSVIAIIGAPELTMSSCHNVPL